MNDGGCEPGLVLERWFRKGVLFFVVGSQSYMQLGDIMSELSIGELLDREPGSPEILDGLVGQTIIGCLLDGQDLVFMLSGRVGLVVTCLAPVPHQPTWRLIPIEAVLSRLRLRAQHEAELRRKLAVGWHMTDLRGCPEIAGEPL